MTEKHRSLHMQNHMNSEPSLFDLFHLDIPQGMSMGFIWIELPFFGNLADSLGLLESNARVS